MAVAEAGLSSKQTNLGHLLLGGSPAFGAVEGSAGRAGEGKGREKT